MIPLLLLSNNSQETKKYLKKITKNDSFFFELKPENKEYSINDIKTLIKLSNFYHKETRIYFLDNFHLSSLEAQNAFLKLLEEPPLNTLFILSAESESSLISTIVSRVRKVYLKKELNYSLEKKEKEELNKLILNKNNKFLLKTTINLDQIIIFFRERLITDKNSAIILKEALRLKYLIQNNNLNPQLCLDHLLILISKTYKMNL